MVDGGLFQVGDVLDDLEPADLLGSIGEYSLVVGLETVLYLGLPVEIDIVVVDSCHVYITMGG